VSSGLLPASAKEGSENGQNRPLENKEGKFEAINRTGKRRKKW